MAQAPKLVTNPVPANTKDFPIYILQELPKTQGT